MAAAIPNVLTEIIKKEIPSEAVDVLTYSNV
jgi:hypothetical protein